MTDWRRCEEVIDGLDSPVHEGKIPASAMTDLTPAPTGSGPSGPAAAGTPPASFRAAIDRALRPMVRVMIRFGLTLPALMERIKRLYVEEAATHFALPDRPLTDSRISLLTGVHRKDVRRLRHQGEAGRKPKKGRSLGAQVLGAWLGAPAYRDQDGGLIPLPRSSANAPSFEALVSSISTDIRPRALLDEWLAVGLLVERPDGLLELDPDAAVPSGDFDETAWYLGRNLRDHAAAATHNLVGETPPMFERAVFYDGLTERSAAALRRLGAQEAMALLQEINQRAYERADADADVEDNDHRFTLGIYIYSGRDDPDALERDEPE